MTPGRILLVMAGLLGVATASGVWLGRLGEAFNPWEGRLVLYGLPLLALGLGLVPTARRGRRARLFGAGIGVSVLGAVVLSGPMMLFFLFFGTTHWVGAVRAMLGAPGEVGRRELESAAITLAMGACGAAFFLAAAWALLSGLRLLRK